MAKYPNRGRFFSNRVTRLMTKACAAQEIGSEGAWLVAVVAGVEDSKRYTGAVTFYNEQLMPLCVFWSRSTLVRARTLAVDAGWLHYEPGGKGTPGRYWATVPARYAKLDDSPVDETPDAEPAAELVKAPDVAAWISAAEAGDQAGRGLRLVGTEDLEADQVDQAGGFSRTESVRQTAEPAAKCRTESVRQRDGNATANGRLSIPSPNPCPTEDSRTAGEPASTEPKADQVEKPGKGTPAGVFRLVDWWNGLHAAGLVRASVKRDPVSSAVLSGFRRYERSAELRELLGDLVEIEQRIRASSFVRKAGWFTLAKLLGGKNKAGEYVAEILKNGGYEDDKRPANGPGQRYQPTGNGSGGAARFRATRDAAG